MRHTKKFIEKCRRMGLNSGKSRENKRLAHAVDAKTQESYLVFEIGTHNPRTGVYHFMEIRHEHGNGNDRYYVYLNGVRWRKQFSRVGFCNWLFGKIDSVRSD